MASKKRTRHLLTTLGTVLTAALLMTGVGAAAAAEAPAPSPAPASRETSSWPSLHPDLVAGSVASFRAGDIISDANMYNGSAMSSGDVQSFLNERAQTCDGNCANTKFFATTSQSANAECTAYAGGGLQSVADIVAGSGAACGVSQKALLALIQKESSVIDTRNPTDAQYDYATFYECPDTSSCDPAYAGFFKQVYNAARQLKHSKLNPPAAFPVGQSTNIAYSPNSGCGSDPVFIRTVATAALYSYTPYQPNAAALQPGSDGNACSSLGNLNFWFVYTDWFGYPHIDVDRIQGADRFEVSVNIAKQAYPNGAAAVYVAAGAGYADALSAGPAAVKDGAPLLLTTADSLPASVDAEIQALHPGKIVIVGGPNSVSVAVESRLGQIVAGGSANVTRISGADRFEVSRNVARYAFGSGASKAYLATGLNFPDALSASGAGGAHGEPVVLVNGQLGAVDSDTSSLLSSLNITTVAIAGGPNSVSSGIESSLSGVSGVTSVFRLSGADRFAASLTINQSAYQQKTDRVFLATGLNFPDALAGSALAGKLGAPLIVVPQNCVPSTVRASFQGFDNTKVTLLGGPNSLGAGVQSLTSCG
ncbi:cell wall-binding repeat-containing protein [Herbiconiux sp. 11R-BC]|uniref:cell wall-binding repeat-containing protein n=1 Tax=Herbiconiux sp. 11R-BC TaxID=3111637 RepID=UPI003C0276CF